MPRPKVYGKRRCRALYDTRAADFSSPSRKTQEHQEPPTKTARSLQAARGERQALGHKSLNALVQPIEVIETFTKIQENQKPQRKVKDGSTPLNNQSVHTPRKLDAVHVESIDQENIPEQEAMLPTSHDVEDTKGSSRRTADLKVQDTGMEHSPEPRVLKRRVKQKMAVPCEHAHTTTPQTPYETHCQALLSLSSYSLTSFEDWARQMSEHFSITKIAEASFGEVYRLSLLKSLSGFGRADESVFKIISLTAPDSLLPTEKRKRQAALKKAESMSKPLDVANEVKLLQRMSSIPGFTNYRETRVISGRPPPSFISAFQAFNAEQKTKGKDLSHFPDPSKKANYAADQLWAVIEMQDAGSDLERLIETKMCTSIWSTWDIFWSVVLSLAKGEEGAQFEHRDLHLGNICVRGALFSAEAIDIKRKLGFTSLETTIIDYTISRAIMADTSVAHFDLAQDSAIFEGDSTDEYQYDIYRYMRSALFLDDASADYHANLAQAQQSGRSWEQYHPQTNLVWLHFILWNLLEQLAWPSRRKAPKKAARAEHAQWKRANELEHILLKAQELLDPAAICANSMWSARDLVALALSEGWIDEKDIVGEDSSEIELLEDLEGLRLC